MRHRTGKLLLWSPRILGVAVCLFLGLFTVDAFGGGRTFIQAIPDFAIHVVPMIILAAVVGVSWRWEWVGGLVFTGLALGYTYFARNNVSWILIIAGPLLIVGVLFCWSWVYHRELRASA